MSYFTPAGSANWATFADRKWRKVVVQHEFFRILFDQTFHALFVAAKTDSALEGWELAASVIDDGLAKRKLEELIGG